MLNCWFGINLKNPSAEEESFENKGMLGYNREGNIISLLFVWCWLNMNQLETFNDHIYSIAYFDETKLYEIGNSMNFNFKLGIFFTVLICQLLLRKAHDFKPLVEIVPSLWYAISCILKYIFDFI
jgi:hypothetical protein